MILSLGRFNLWFVEDPSRGRRKPDVYCQVRRKRAFAITLFGYRVAAFFV